MCRKLVSCADFRAILMPLSEVIYSTFEKNGKADHYILNWPDVTPQIAFSSTGKVPNLNKSNSSIKPNKFHSKYVCFGGRKSQEEQKISVKLTSSAFLRPLWRGMRQRPLTTWFHSQLWLVHFNLSVRWQHNPPLEGNVLVVVNQVSY